MNVLLTGEARQDTKWGDLDPQLKTLDKGGVYGEHLFNRHTSKLTLKLNKAPETR
jgi:hypothetical protein